MTTSGSSAASVGRVQATGQEPGEERITVLIVDDHRLVRAGFRVILGEEFAVAGEAADGAQAIALTRELRPDVVLMDIRMPTMDGLTAARTIIGESLSRVIILTTFDADEYVYEALRAGASGFMLKDSPPEQLMAAVRAAAAGDALIDASVTRRFISSITRAIRPPQPRPPELAALTVRELAVLELISRGLSNIEIAQALTVEETTVKTHVGRILAKLGLRDRVQVVILAYETGLVERG
jgi:DNA-binding NarL/FixJ family response regulator